MKKSAFIMALCVLFFIAVPTHAADAPETVNVEPQHYATARITAAEPFTATGGRTGWNIAAVVDSGDEDGKTINVQYFDPTVGDDLQSPQPQSFSVGEKIVVIRTGDAADPQYYMTDRYRIPALVIITGIFFLLIVIFAGRRGLFSFSGLAFTILVLALYVVPRIAHGANPLVISFIGAVVIAVCSLYLAHGFNKRTTIALVSTLVIIGVSLALSSLFVNVAELTGLGSEEAYYVQSSALGAINVKGLLLGGIIIGLLGVLDDVTTAQAATVDELKKANPSFGFRELYRRGSSVGREHITSLVNTLVLAYAGTSMPLLLLFSFHVQPFWVSLNSEFISEEIIRTLVGSTVLVLAVPFTTVLAAYLYNAPWFQRIKRPHDSFSR